MGESVSFQLAGQLDTSIAVQPYKTAPDIANPQYFDVSKVQDLCCRASTGSSKAKASGASSAGIRDWCHNFDLTKPVPVQDLKLSRMVCTHTAAM